MSLLRFNSGPRNAVASSGDSACKFQADSRASPPIPLDSTLGLRFRGGGFKV